MKNPPPAPSRFASDTECSLLLARYPVRLLHYAELGVILGCLLVLGFHSIDKKSPRLERVVWEERLLPDPSPIIPTNPGDEENPDRDGDGIPNEWETTHSHNPDFAADAGSDFDNDGLTALQEYQLWLRTSGQSGNPLGKWRAEKIALAPPRLIGDVESVIHYSSSVMAANNAGALAIQYSFYGLRADDTEVSDEYVALVHPDGAQEIISIPEKTSGYTYAYDMNENGDILLQWYSDGWGECHSYIQKGDGTTTELRINGNPTHALRINNFGDWIGYEIDENGNWVPVHAIDEINILPDDSFTDWSVSDINDLGQIIGTYYDYYEQKYLTFTKFGSIIFSTGKAGDFPHYDPSQNIFVSPAALNKWGEFAATAGGYSASQHQTGSYFFDGEFEEIELANNPDYSHITGLSESGMVLIGSGTNQPWEPSSTIWRENVSADLELLIPDNGLTPGATKLISTAITPGGVIYISAYDDSEQFVVDMLSIHIEQDADADGMPDDWEEFYGFNPNLNDANLDSDGDGTNNLGEFLLRSDPHAVPDYNPENELIDTRPGVDTDGDGIPNNWEVVNGMNYQDPSDAALDFDRDGYSNLQEFRLNTDPRGAPAYRIRQIGPFSGVYGADISRATLSEGSISGNPNNSGGDQMAEEVFFTASITPNISGPVMWSQPRTEDNGVLSFYPSATEESRTLVAHSPTGAVLTRNNSYPQVYTYWSSPNADPVSLTAIENDISISDLYYATLSPSGKYLYAIRQNSLGIFEPIAWKMPSTENTTYQPVVITAPEGASIETWLTAHINDYGIITANGLVNGQTRGLVWTMDEYGNSLEGTILPNLSGDNYSYVVGISNHSAPIIAGTSFNSENQERASVWKYTGPTSCILSDLGILPNGNVSQIVKISPNGTLAGVANTLHENELKQHVICAVPVIPSSSDSIDPTLYHFTPQGEPSRNGASISHVTNAGEIIAQIYNASSVPELYLLSHGKSHSLESSIPSASGYELEEIIGINAQGSLLVTALKDNSLERILLTPDRDTDGDGLPDAWENAHQFNLFSKNSRNADTDNDGLTDLLEYANGTHPRITDTDGDGMKDGWEVEWGLLPLEATDAQLDPDEDRVTNLRESQIGTVPTGVYKVETRHVDTDWQYPQILTAGDDGTIVRSGGYTYHVIGENYEYGYDYSQNVFALPPVASNVTFQLPDNRHSFCYNRDWTQFSYSNSRANYFSDSASGKIHADRYRQLHQSGPNGGENIYEEAYFLTPDITNFPNESDWISFDTIEHNLRNPDLHNGSPPLRELESFIHYNASVSPSGTRRLYTTDWGQQLLLNERGELAGHLPNGLHWHIINDQGLAAGIVINEGPETAYSTHCYLPWLFLSDGQSLLLPHDPSSPISPDWALLFYSNDGKILLRNFYQNEQFSWSYRFFLYDSTTGRLDRIRLPASDYSSVSSLSNQNGRMLIQGSKPSQITPDGTCIRLDALRVTDEIHDTPVPLREVYPNIITPSHISSDGRITLSTTNSNGNNVIIQITSYNDANNDGLPDDWTQAHNVTNPDADDDGDRLSNRREFELGTDPKKEDTDNDGILDSIDGNPKVPATPTTDSDGDGVFDLEDAVPNDGEINWKKTPEVKYVWVEQVTHTNDANQIGPPIAINKDAQILFGLNLYSEITLARTLWSSALKQWVQLPAKTPEQFLLSDTYPELLIQNTSAAEMYDINDQGVIVGKSCAGFIEPIALISRILIWSKNPQNQNTYLAPRGYFSQLPIAFPHYATDFSNAAISNDGTINTTGQYSYFNFEAHWLTHHNTSVPQQASMSVQKNLGQDGSGIAGAILDLNRALLIEKSPNLLSLDKILLKENTGISNLTVMNAPTITVAEMSELPLDKADKTPRLWITNGNSSWIEKRDGGVGASRWHKPASMEGERIIRVSKQGVAITAGNTWQSSPPKLWRNGTYTNLNDSNLTSKPADVKITNAIDIASNGIILVQATEGAVKKTGFLLPFDIEGYKRGTINAPGARVPKGSGEYGQETVMMENANSQDNTTQPDYVTAAVDKAKDDDLVKVVLRWPKDLKISGVRLELKHKGMEVDPTKTSDADKYKEVGDSRLNFYKPDGTKLTEADLKIDDLGTPGTGYLAQILATGELTLFVEGAENFGNLGLTASKMKLLGGAMVNFEVTHSGITSRARLLVYRGGFLVFRQPNGQPGQAGIFEFWDGKGRVKNKNGGYQNEFQEDVTDWGTRLKSWAAKSGKPNGSADYRLEGHSGYTPPGWWWTREDQLDETEQQLHSASGKITNRDQANEKWNQAPFTRWQQDDTPASQRYTANYVYNKIIPHDAQVGKPVFIEYKFRLFAIPPSTPYNRKGLLIHPDGKKDGTLGCIGLQTWEGANEAAHVLRRYHGLKLKVQHN